MGIMDDFHQVKARIIVRFRDREANFYFSHSLVANTSVAYAGFSKGVGARKFSKFETNEDQNENFLQPEILKFKKFEF